MTNDPAHLSIAEASAKLASKELTSADLTRACLAQIEAKNTSLNAYLEVFNDALAQAESADARRAAGESNPLLGIPLAIKDNILIEGKRASASSKILENYVASYDATVIRKLKEAGAVFLGRTNMDEFAMGGSTENSAFGPTKNPLDESRVPGGSSGGSAAAVAAGMALGSLGSDTGGSIREPAAFCGLVGLKPTYGAVSRSGLMAMGSSLDQIGPFARTVEDAEILFHAIRGRDPLDSTSIDEDLYPRPAQKKKIGVPRALIGQGMDADVLARFEAGLEKLKGEGYEIVEIGGPLIELVPLALSTYYILMPAEVSANLARFDGVRYGLSLQGESLFSDYAKTRGEGFGLEVRRRIMLGTYVLSSGYYDAYYGKATHVRQLLAEAFSAELEKVDAIAVPTTPTPAFKLGEKSDPLLMYLTDIFTVSANLTGHPAITIPCGAVSRDGKELPVGMQLTAAFGDEAGLFAIGKHLENRVQ